MEEEGWEVVTADVSCWPYITVFWRGLSPSLLLFPSRSLCPSPWSSPRRRLLPSRPRLLLLLSPHPSPRPHLSPRLLRPSQKPWLDRGHHRVHRLWLAREVPEGIPRFLAQGPGDRRVQLLFMVEPNQPGQAQFPVAEFQSYLLRHFQSSLVVVDEERLGCLANTRAGLDKAFECGAEFTILAEEPGCLR